MLSAHSLRLGYRGRWVLQIENLELPAGSRIALVGPNGSGKSTLLRILAFIEQPTHGELRFDGQPVRTRRDRLAARRRVTLVEQQPLLFDTTVKANLMYALRLRHVRHADAADLMRSAVERVGIEHLVTRSARELSGGEIQRVAIARALVLRPEVLLLDEPQSSADQEMVSRLPALMEELRAAGTTVCFSSHRLEETYRLADRIIALVDGKLSPAAPENLFRTTVPPGTGPRVVQAGPLALLVVTDKVGPATVAIPADDIVVSTEPLHSSARNQFHGKIVRLADDGRGGVALTVDVGTELLVRITRAALADLNLSVGSSVVLSIKTMALRVF